MQLCSQGSVIGALGDSPGDLFNRFDPLADVSGALGLRSACFCSQVIETGGEGTGFLTEAAAQVDCDASGRSHFAGGVDSDSSLVGGGGEIVGGSCESAEVVG